MRKNKQAYFMLLELEDGQLQCLNSRLEPGFVSYQLETAFTHGRIEKRFESSRRGLELPPLVKDVFLMPRHLTLI